MTPLDDKIVLIAAPLVVSHISTIMSPWRWPHLDFRSRGLQVSDSPERISISTEPPSTAVLAALQVLIPGAVADGVIDAQRIAEAAGLPVAGLKDGRERFGLMWAGKSKAVEALQAPSLAALVPDMENSIDWDTAENVFIEGDNLEVLKLLQKAYNDQVKLIYIDPPYNTASDLIYEDDFADSVKRYLEVTGQVDAAGNRVVANAEVNGRKHSSWLCMMYPRLLLARNLLQNDGLIFVSIDDNEVVNLRLVMDEIFGPQNFLGQLPTIMNLKGNNDQFGFAGIHEYTVVYARNKSSVTLGEFLVDEEGLENWEVDEFGPFKVGANLKATGANAPRAKRPNLFFPLYISESMEVSCSRGSAMDAEMLPITAGEEMSWRWSKEKFAAETHNLIVRKSQNSYSLYKKQRPEIGDIPTKKPKSVLYDPSYSSGNGTQQLKQIFDGEVPFSHPKPLKLIQDLILLANDKNAIVMDFFAGSGTTAHAVYEQNRIDGGNRKYVLVNIPDEILNNPSCEKLGLTKISEVTRERIVRLIGRGADVRDFGLRSYRLSKSAFVDLNPEKRDGVLELFTFTLDLEARESSIAAEVFLKNGVRLDMPWTQVDIDAQPTFISDGVAVVLSKQLTDDVVNAARDLESVHTVVFLEDGFAGRDSVKANAHFAFKNANKTMKTV